MKFFLAPILFALLIISQCGNAPNSSNSTKTENFTDLKADFIDQLWQLNPAWGTWAGFHNYDSLLTIPSPAYREKKTKAYNEILARLDNTDKASLSQTDRGDYELMTNFLKSTIWYMQELKDYEWNPSQFNLSGSFHKILGSQHADLKTRMDDIYLKLRTVPEFYESGIATVKNPILEHTNLGISQNKGGRAVFQEIRDSLKVLNYSEIKTQVFEERIKDAEAAIDGYVKFLEEDILPQIEGGGKSFRLGKELYAKKFNYDINSGYTAEEIYKIAEAEKQVIHKKMFKLVPNLWPKYMTGKDIPDDSLYMVKLLIEEISKKHVHRDDFLKAIEEQIPELERFVNEKQLIYLDPSKPLKVRATPAYMGGVAGASISSPGPYEKNAKTYYNVTPLTNYSDEDAESYLREYNHYMLQILNIHEAVPGHYTQAIYANQSPSLIKSILGNGTMVEGWACYVERMMLEEGYGNQAPELWLMYHKWNLRIVANALLDYGIHNNGMTEEQAMDLMVNEAFQERIEAEKKWKRARLTQVQLCSYFTGLTAIYNLREELKTKMGADFDLKTFHEDFLSYGSAPVPFVREMLMEKYGLN